MKTNLNFKTVLELDQFIERYILDHPYKFIKHLRPEKKIKENVVLPVKRFTKEPWSQYELQFLVDNWNTKKVEWIARSLRRKYQTVIYMSNLLRKKGADLPLKRKIAKKVIES